MDSITLDKSFVRPPYSKVCTYCRHFRPELPGETCAAFPDGIPYEIWRGRDTHHKPYPGDRGVQFEPLPRKENNISTG